MRAMAFGEAALWRPRAGETSEPRTAGLAPTGPALAGSPLAGSSLVRQSLAKPSLAGQSAALLRAVASGRQAAASEADILIEAESGTGKEVLARMIHQGSSRRGRPFVAVNCSAVPEALLESELFGHAKGAYTGANAAQVGQIESAQGGTLLLDEIGEMPLHLQPKLLRVLQERELRRLGENRNIQVDIRVVATTNRSLAGMVREGLFRADLYYRLNVVALTLPPLRERSEDIPLLAEHFLERYATGRGLRLAGEFLQRLCEHSWPGNVRELENSIRRAVALSPGEEITAELQPGLFEAANLAKEAQLNEAQLAGNVLSDAGSVGAVLHPGMKMQDMERTLLERTLAATGGNRSRAAVLLGISLRTVRNKIRAYGLPSRGAYGAD